MAHYPNWQRRQAQTLYVLCSNHKCVTSFIVVISLKNNDAKNFEAEFPTKVGFRSLFICRISLTGKAPAIKSWRLLIRIQHSTILSKGGFIMKNSTTEETPPN